jgi:hypothetical protein
MWRHVCRSAAAPVRRNRAPGTFFLHLLPSAGLNNENEVALDDAQPLLPSEKQIHEAEFKERNHARRLSTLRPAVDRDN